MPTLPIRTGFDTHVLEATPTSWNNNNARFPKIRTGDEIRTLLYMPFNATRIAGKVVLSAILSCAVDENWITQTVTIQGLATSIPSRVWWTNKPAVTGPTANSGATGALDPGDRFTIDITALIQEIADGEPNNGWQLTTSQSTQASWFRGFESGYESWALDIEFVDRPDAPDELSPEGIIGINKWVVSVDDYDELAEVQLQVDATPSGTSPDYDTGWVPVTKPQVNLAATFPDGETNGVADTTFNGLANNDTIHVRGRVKLLNGGTSLYGPWHEVTRVDKPTIVMDSPSGTDIWDPTPVIQAHLSSGGDDETRWQVIISNVNDPTDQRYNSGNAITGEELNHPIPLRWKDRNVMVDDGTYRLEVRAWDRSDRAASPGDLPYARVLVDVTMDVDGTQTAPHSLTAVSTATTPHEYPGIMLSWERAADPDWFLIRRDGKFLATVDVNDYRTSPAHWSWEDVTADPNVSHAYTVRAVTVVGAENRQSAGSNLVNEMAVVEGVWLRSEFGDVLLDGTGIGDWRQVSKRQVYNLPFRDDDVDVITANGGWRGSFEGIIDDFQGRDVDADRAVLEEIRTHPRIPVRLVAATFNQLVTLRDLSVPPAPDMLAPDLDRTHTVSFSFSQVPNLTLVG